MSPRENIGGVVLPFAFALVLAQFIFLGFAVTTLPSDSPLCNPRVFSGAARGWEKGVCLTEEQVWCNYHGSHRHVNCPSADCRAEEVRLSLFSRNNDDKAVPSKDPMYAGCPKDSVTRIWHHIESMNPRLDATPSSRWAGRTSYAPRTVCAACVPAGDKRSIYLPGCTEVQAACRGLFYEPPRTYAGPLIPLACPRRVVNVTNAASDDFGCPGDLSRFADSWSYPKKF